MVEASLDADRASSISRGRFAGWRMLIIAFLAQNCAIGMNFGVYGTLVEEIQREFSTSRAWASSGLSMMTLVMGLLSPVIGTMVQRIPLRVMMIAGAAICAVGHILLSMAGSIEWMLAIYALVLGPGVCLLGVIPSSTLVSRWFVRGRGRALGFVNMPFFVFVFPMVAAAILGAYDLDAVFFTLAMFFTCLIPILFFIVEDPKDLGQMALGAAEAAATDAGAAPAGLTTSQILLHPSFIVLVTGIGLLTAGGVMMVTHLVPLAQDKGVDLTSASLLLSAFGISGALGALLFGWVADRIGGARALAIQAFLWTLPWLALLFVGAELPILLAVAVLLGVCSGAIVGLCGVIANSWLGPENFGRVMGYCYFLKVPFMFGAAPLAGYLVDMTGSYRTAIIGHIATFIFVGLLFLFYSPRPAPKTARGLQPA